MSPGNGKNYFQNLVGEVNQMERNTFLRVTKP